MPTLDRRVRGLEAKLGTGSTEDAERLAQFRAAFSALCDACEPNVVRGIYALAARIDTGQTTQADRDMLASLPPFYESPEFLVRVGVYVHELRWGGLHANA